MGQYTLHIDDQTWHLDYNHPGTPCRGVIDDVEWALAPLQFQDHCALLEHHLNWHDGTLELDETGYAAELLVLNKVPEALHAHIAPVCLWWAAGAPESPHQVDVAGLRCRPWSHGQRLQALHHARDHEHFYPVVYIQAMLTMCVEQVPASWPSQAQWHAGQFNAALDQVTACNGKHGFQQDLAALDETQRSQLITLCRTMGWTPRQVLAMPAVEVDELLELLGTAPAPQPMRSGPKNVHSDWVQQSDAVMITIEDEGTDS